MTKEEVIQQAYGEYWEQAKEFVDEKGWFNRGKLKYKDCLFLFGKDSLLFEKYAQDYFRPKSLQGIEHNNGWIKIESEKDLPEENGTYFTHSKTYYKPFFRVDVFCGRLRNSFQNGTSCFTHYQPIIKTKPPIY
jgi:hypothetical protein